MDLTPFEIPQRLIRQLFELDADYAEALWALDQPPGTLDLKAMLRDTLAALEQLPKALARFRKNLPPGLIPVWPSWNPMSARVCPQPKPTTWFQAVIPNPVKHPGCGVAAGCSGTTRQSRDDSGRGRTAAHRSAGPRTGDWSLPDRLPWSKVTPRRDWRLPLFPPCIGCGHVMPSAVGQIGVSFDQLVPAAKAEDEPAFRWGRHGMFPARPIR